MKTLKEVRRELEIINSDIRALQDNKRDLRKVEAELREKESGLVPYETMVREVEKYGPEKGGPGRLGQFIGFYAGYRGSDWVEVRLVKKNGETGLRQGTFYEWRIEA